MKKSILFLALIGLFFTTSCTDELNDDNQIYETLSIDKDKVTPPGEKGDDEGEGDDEEGVNNN